jgi:GNAT superfamily N-acetyltransferase
MKRRGALWRAARQLSDEPEQYWSFPMMTNRVLVSERNGLDFAYESVSTWHAATNVVRLKGWLDADSFTARNRLSPMVSLGMETFDGVLRSQTGHLRPPESWERFRGRHVVAVVGWEPSTDEIVFVNSWGRSWGHNGLGFVGREFFEAHVDSFNVARPTWVGYSPAAEGALNEVDDPLDAFGNLRGEAMVQAWRTGNPRQRSRITVDGARCVMGRHSLLTLAAGARYDVIELREGGDFRGRIHVEHHEERRGSVVTELWVSPPYRRRGFASVLLEVGEGLARKAGSIRVRLPLHEADATVVGRERAEAFATARGYTWTARATRRPNYEALGVKSLSRSVH